jgi:hypothetical protein
MDKEPVGPDHRPGLVIVESGILDISGDDPVADLEAGAGPVADDRLVIASGKASRAPDLELRGVAPKLARPRPDAGQEEFGLAVRLAAEAKLDVERAASIGLQDGRHLVGDGLLLGRPGGDEKKREDGQQSTSD